MSDRSLRRIRSVEARPGYRLAVSWDQGRVAVVDLSDMISRGGVFTKLSDKNKFALVRVGENSRIMEWPEPSDEFGYPIIEIDADALFLKSQEQEDRVLASTMRNLVDNARKIGRIVTMKSRPSP